MTKLSFLTACWWLFILFWVISAFSAKPAKERQDWGGRLFTFAFLTVTFLLLAGKIPWRGINTRLWPDEWPLRLPGYTFTLAGLVTLIWSRLSLGTNWSATVTFREGHELIERGPYRFVRHPMYSGILLMVAGTAIVLGNTSGLISLFICFLGHWWKLSAEEALLMKHFPDTYQLYRSRTRALIPFIL
ncbi:MAG: isoprenylcysteine carboxylmethyltransferase family protein [Sedimentisphaerales bacterium]|jgi:protein-S-isoprenylcysteine O-methyltransferase Ste14